MTSQILLYSIIIAVATILLVVIGLFLYSRSRGKILIELDKYSFSPGETVNGKIKLTIKKPLNADSLNVGLHAIVKSSQITLGHSSSRSSQKTKEVFRFSQPIVGAKSYAIGEQEYPFSIVVPSDAIKKIDGVMGSIVNAISIVSGSPQNVKWYIDANLAISGFNLKKSIQINVV